MASHEMTRTYHHGSLRDAVVDLACDVIEAEGREALSLRDLARRLGVSHAAPARHFGDRDGLLDALAERALSELASLVDTDAAPSDPGERLVEFFLAFARYGAGHPHLVRLMNERKDGDRLAEQSARTFAGPVGSLTAARTIGLVADPTGATAEQVLEVLLLGVLDVAARTEPSEQLDDLVRVCTRVALAGLAPSAVP